MRERSETRHVSGNGFLDRISKLTHGSRSRNPAKKSASFTFAVRPELAMKAQERYSSLEPEATQSHSNNHNSKQPVQRSVSTSVLEVPADVEIQPTYSRVRDSLTPLPPPPKPPPKAEDIYTEICENATIEPKLDSPTRPVNQIQSQSKVEVEVKSLLESQPRAQIRTKIQTQSEFKPQIQPRILPQPRFQNLIQIQPQILPRIQTQFQQQPPKNPGSHVISRIKIIVKSKESYENERVKKEGPFVNSVMITHGDSIIRPEDEIIYNSIY